MLAGTRSPESGSSMSTGETQVPPAKSPQLMLLQAAVVRGLIQAGWLRANFAASIGLGLYIISFLHPLSASCVLTLCTYQCNVAVELVIHCLVLLTVRWHPHQRGRFHRHILGRHHRCSTSAPTHVLD